MFCFVPSRAYCEPLLNYNGRKYLVPLHDDRWHAKKFAEPRSHRYGRWKLLATGIIYEIFLRSLLWMLFTHMTCCIVSKNWLEEYSLQKYNLAVLSFICGIYLKFDLRCCKLSEIKMYRRKVLTVGVCRESAALSSYRLQMRFDARRCEHTPADREIAETLQPRISWTFVLEDTLLLRIFV